MCAWQLLTLSYSCALPIVCLPLLAALAYDMASRESTRDEFIDASGSGAYTFGAAHPLLGMGK